MDEPIAPTPEAFLPHVEKKFHVQGGRHILKLYRVDTPPQGHAPRQPFTLLFSGPPGDVLRQGLYTLEVEGGPAFQLYVIPVQTFARDRQDYQAVFN
jgi:hypothetical protein